MPAELAITGLGITCAIGQGAGPVSAALLRGDSAFTVMQREGRQKASCFLGAEIGAITLPSSVAPQTVRTASLSSRVALATLAEAWSEAALDDVDPERIGLIVGGSNFQQREHMISREAHGGNLDFVRPTSALSLWDTDVCGLCTDQFGIRGFAHTVGGASASGQLAVIQAARAVTSGEVDVCIALGALMDLSCWECQSLRAIGAMGSDRYARQPELACRPFDRDTDGFIFGEACGALVIERADAVGRPQVRPRARLAGWSIVMDGNRNPDPSLDGEVQAVRRALAQANLRPRDIDYVNPHGTGSPRGDATEAMALQSCDLGHARINTTKSLLGHALTAAGAVELVVTLLQMRAGELHPSRNLEHPIDDALNWVRHRSVPHRMRNALSLSLGFGGLNTVVCLHNCD